MWPNYRKGIKVGVIAGVVFGGGLFGIGMILRQIMISEDAPSVWPSTKPLSMLSAGIFLFMFVVFGLLGALRPEIKAKKDSDNPSM